MIRRGLRHLLNVLAGVLFLLVLLLVSARILLPLWPDPVSAVEQRVGMLIEREVRVGSVRLGWAGWAPELVANEVRISVPGGIPLHARELGVSLAPWRSLRAMTPMPGRARLRGVALTVQRSAEGGLDIHGWRFGRRDSAVGNWRRYLAGLDRLEVEDASIQWSDQRTGIHAGVRVQMLALRSDASGLRVVALGGLLPEAGGAVRLGLEIPASDPGQAEFYLDLEALQLAYWSRFSPASRGLEGRSSVSVWGAVRDGHITRIQGEHTTQVLTSRQRGRRVDSLAHRFHWRRDQDRAVSLWTGLTPGSGDASIEYSRTDSASASLLRRFEVGAADLDLGRYARIMAATRAPVLPALEHLEGLQPSGNLEALDLLLVREGDPWDVQRADVTVSDVSFDALDGIPGIAGIDVSIDWSQGRGAVALTGSGVSVAMPRLFRDELRLDRFRADMLVERTDDGWMLEATELSGANADAAVDGRGLLELGAEPSLDLALRFLRGDAAQVARYLPEHRLPPRTYGWLAQSILAGTVLGGGMVYRGDPREFPFADQQGVFDARVTMSDGLLDYRPGWPRARELSGTLVFRNAGFAFEGGAGIILDSQVNDLEVDIPNMRREAVLNLRGRVAGPLDDLLVYLGAAGIGDEFARYRDEMRPGGESEMDLVLAMPLHGPGPAATRVSGQLTVGGARVELPEVPLILEQVAGELRFGTHEGIRGSGIRARVHGEPVVIDLARDANSTLTRVRASGRQPFAPWLWALEGWQETVRGMAHWDADIGLDPNGESFLELSSNLEGVEIDWPAPLAKTQGTRRVLDIAWPLGPPGAAVGRIRFDGVLAADVRMRAESPGQTPRIQAVAAHLGSPLPDRLALPAGGMDLRVRLPAVDVDAWTRALETLTGHAVSLEPADGEGLNLVRGDIEVLDTLRWQGRSFSGGRATLATVPGGRQVSLDADWVRGEALLRTGDAPGAAVSGRGHWQVALERLRLDRPPENAAASEGGSGGALADPRNWPALDLSVAELQVGDVRMADLELVLSPVPSGLDLPRLRLRSPEPGLNFSGSGQWTRALERGNRSEFALMLNGDDWGRGLGSTGIAQTLEAGSGTGNVDLSWPGPLYAPDVAGLVGRVDLNLSDGRLLDVEPGAGRLLGLVSLDLIPRRIGLDFRDLYTQGLSFDRMRGEAVIDGGELLLPELEIRSPSAVVRVSGRTGLVARDFDQSIVVVPRLRSTLPIVGALVGGPVAGAVVLLVERALGIGDQVEEAARVEYFVTGSWSNPEVRARVRRDPGTTD